MGHWNVLLRVRPWIKLLEFSRDGFWCGRSTLCRILAQPLIAYDV